MTLVVDTRVPGSDEGLEVYNKRVSDSTDVGFGMETEVLCSSMTAKILLLLGT